MEKYSFSMKVKTLKEITDNSLDNTDPKNKGSKVLKGQNGLYIEF